MRQAVTEKMQEPNAKVIKVMARDLVVHPIVQRELMPHHLADLVKNFDLDAIGVLHGAQYPINGITKIWIIDGQHRLCAAMEHGFDDLEFEVKIHLDCQTDERAAELFLLLNHRAKVSPYDTFLNEMKANNAAAIIINRTVRELGLEIARSKGDHRLSCIKALKDLYQEDQGRSLRDTISIVTRAWGTESAALEGKIIEGVGMVVSRYRTAIEYENLIAKLSSYPGRAAAFLGDAKALAGMRKMPLAKCVAEKVIETYNKQRRQGTLAPLESVAEEA
jgi:hypothetical protein